MGGGVFFWALARGRLLLYGDATAHLMIARRMFDSLTPGLSQWGTVWLPFPHLLMAPWVAIMTLWRTGAAGSIVSVAAFAFAAYFLHRITARHLSATAGGWAAVFFVLNPNVLYLAAVPMTETVYLAAFLGAVDSIGRYSETRADRYIISSALWALAGAMTRYDGWFCLPFFALAIWAAGGWRAAWRFSAVAAVGPVFWLIYNFFYFGDALAFLRGPYSARQIYLNALRHGGFRYPGDHHLALATLYYLKCAALDCGVPLLVLAALGLGVWLFALGRPADWQERGARLRSPLLLLVLPLPWYLWAMWSGNVPIFMPMYWPHGYYNMRYGVQLLPAAAAWSAALVVYMRARQPRWRAGVLAGLALLVLVSYAAMLRGQGPMTYAEAVHNAPARLAMEDQLAAALAPRQRGEKLLMFLGSYPGALADDGIALRDVIQESNFQIWDRALAAPQDYVAWVVVQQGTLIDRAINHAALARFFVPVARFSAPLQASVTVWRARGYTRAGR